MISCLVAGDSIAVDVGRAMHECALHARIGVSSAVIVGYAAQTSLCVISAGSNDPDNPRLAANLEAIRARCGGKVVWVLPIHPRARGLVLAIARRHGDAMASFAPAHDNVHPRFIAPLVAQIRKAAAP